MANTPVSPKVTAGASVAALVGLLLQYVTTITPDTFAFLGQYQGLAFLIVTLAGGALAAWWKTDPLRSVPADPAANAASDVVTGSANAPRHAAAPVPATIHVDPIPRVIHVDPPATS